jgi:hypothetical protein
MNNLDPVAVALILLIITPFALALWADWCEAKRPRTARELRQAEFKAIRERNRRERRLRLEELKR